MSRLTENIRGRTMEFASAIACLRMTLPNGRREVEMLGDQLLRAGTSVAAHVRDASRSRSDAEMRSRLEGAIEQADESVLCLEMSRATVRSAKARSLIYAEKPTKLSQLRNDISRTGGRSL